MNVEPNTSTGFNPSPATPPDTSRPGAMRTTMLATWWGRATRAGAERTTPTIRRVALSPKTALPVSPRSRCIRRPILRPAMGRKRSIDTIRRSRCRLGRRRRGSYAGCQHGTAARTPDLGFWPRGKSIPAYDALGRVTAVGVRLQKPGAAAPALSARYAPRWYVKKQSYDALSRVKVTDTGVDLARAHGRRRKERAPSYVHQARQRAPQVDSSYGVLFAGGVYLADGRTQTFTLGDAATTQRYSPTTRTSASPTVQTYRAAAPLWSAPPPYTPPVLPTILRASCCSKTAASSTTRWATSPASKITASPAEWPATAKPVTRNFEYDDLYRLTRTVYQYGGATDSLEVAVRRRKPERVGRAAEPARLVRTRPTEQKYQYDWLGNITQSTDDQQAFWDRSTGIEATAASR